MTLPVSGPLSLSDIAAEFGGAAPHSLSEYYGADTGIPSSGAISISDFYGKSNLFTLNIAASVANPNIRQLCVNAGWNQSVAVLVNITAPLINTINLPAGTSFPGGIEIKISAGTRVGGVYNSGTAIYTRIPLKVNNLGTISGGGGNGGAGQSNKYDVSGSVVLLGGGGGGGNGQGFASTSSTSILSASAGSPGSSQSNGSYYVQGGTGGAGGSWGSQGGNGLSNASGSSGWVETYPATAGALAGYYIDGNSYVTWVAAGTRLGRVA